MNEHLHVTCRVFLFVGVAAFSFYKKEHLSV
ncbi:hypothetical protein PTHTG4_30420 [Parageobacillus thermoglucosidasius]|nr:hypothetical protein PTHTG4_30420 [Parageobacillus thermoglucosidasius]